MTKGKKFLGKNKVDFQLVHRSQRDCLADDDTVPQCVLVPIEKNNNTALVKNVLAKLPAEVLPGSLKDPKDLIINSKGPKPEWDPDIVAALDDDYDFYNSENELEDNFIQLATGHVELKNEFSNAELDHLHIIADDSSSETSFNESIFSFEDAKSHFTNYSLTSSVLPRSELLQTLDECFEKFFETYTDDKIGALDNDIIEGFIAPVPEQILEYVNTPNQLKNSEIDLPVQKLEETVSDEEHEEDEDIQVGHICHINCQCRQNSKSNLSNYPQIIQVNKKGIATEGMINNKLTHANVKLFEMQTGSAVTPKHSSDILSTLSQLSYRPPNESAENKKLRKHAVHQLRKLRREEKKQNKLAFKKERSQQQKQMLHQLRMMTLSY